MGFGIAYSVDGVGEHRIKFELTEVQLYGFNKTSQIWICGDCYMGLFDVFKKEEKVLTIDEVQEKLYTSLSEYTGWKLLKSQRCLRKRIGNIVFDICFYSSKYNVSGECVEANCEFEFWSKEFDKICNVNSKIGFVFFQADNNYWYDMSTETKLNDAIDDIKKKFDDYVIPLIKVFEKDYCDAITYLSSEDMQELYQLNKFGVFEKMKLL